MKKKVWSIVALGTGEPGQIFDIGADEALPCRGQILLKAQQIDSRLSGGGAERLPGDLAAECVLLQVEEPVSSLNVGRVSATRKSAGS
ncbi:MAG: hypothetical protein J7573_03570 [Pseudomonas sp.]|nr:hypothetical protein [Pseudomonas sp.]